MDGGRPPFRPLMNNAYWSNFRGLTADAYVERYIAPSAVNRRRMEATVAALPAGVKTLLDAGCGFGHFLRLIRDERGIAGVGVEITGEKVEYARRVFGADARVASVDALPFPDQAFDAICALEVIEHLPLDQYEKARTEIARVARRWIVVSVPWKERRRNVRCPACGGAFNPNYHLRSFHDADFVPLFPGFALRSLAGLGERTEAPAWIEWLAVWRQRAWPTFAVCPACGYRGAGPGERPQPDATGDAGPRLPAGGWRGLARDLVRRTHPCWYLALFERIGETGRKMDPSP